LKSRKKKKNTSFKKANLHKINREERIKVTFPYSEDNIEQIQSIAGRKFHEDEKHWTIPLTLDNMFSLKDKGYLFGRSLKEWGNAEYKAQNQLVIPGLKGTLRDYQTEGVELIDKFKGNALLADEMGLGKTIQVISWLLLHKNIRPVVISCPAFLKLNWEYELNKWMPEPNVQVIFGTNTKQTIVGDIIVVGHNLLANKYVDTDRLHAITGKPLKKELRYTGWVDWLIDYAPKALICDEAHYFKSDTAAWTKAIFKLRKKVPYCIPVTGTPLENKTLDIFNPVKLANPNIFKNKWSFQHEYCGPKHNGFGWSFDGATNTKKLHKILTEKVMIRRLKKDVEKDLPPKTTSVIPLSISNREEYLKAENHFKSYLRGTVEASVKDFVEKIREMDEEAPVEIDRSKVIKMKREKSLKANPLYQMTELKKLAAQGKSKEVIEWISSFLSSGKKLIVFCEHTDIMKSIYEAFPKISVLIDGSVPTKKRHLLVKQFQEDDKIKLFIGNAAAQEGLTLTAASDVAMVEYPWNPSKLNQRADRAHRIGQKNPVTMYMLIAIKTIDEKMIQILEKKQALSDAILDGKKVEQIDLISELINSFKND
jgi:SWI/SNF-related matrix-associated actin-dependent regulator 1 of chromatin subfamily A